MHCILSMYISKLWSPRDGVYRSTNKVMFIMNFMCSNQKWMSIFCSNGRQVQLVRCEAMSNRRGNTNCGWRCERVSICEMQANESTLTADKLCSQISWSTDIWAWINKCESTVNFSWHFFASLSLCLSFSLYILLPHHPHRCRRWHTHTFNISVCW